MGGILSWPGLCGNAVLKALTKCCVSCQYTQTLPQSETIEYNKSLCSFQTESMWMAALVFFYLANRTQDERFFMDLLQLAKRCYVDMSP